MITYIWKNISGYYIEYPEEIDAQYWQGKIGSTYQDFLDGKWIKLSNEQLAFKKNNPSASIGEVITMLTFYPSSARTLEDAKREKLAQIEEYDKSDNVNSLTIKLNEETSILTWFTPDKRADYKASIDAAELLGMETVSPVFNGQAISIPIATAKMALAQIQIYANRCYSMTEYHKAFVSNLKTIEAVDNYNYQDGYPEKLVFNLEL